MNEILDHQEELQSGNIYSKISLLTSLLTLMTMVFLGYHAYRNLEGSNVFYRPPFALIIGVFLSSIIGIISAAISFLREESTWYKWVGGILNLLLFLLIFGSMIYAGYKD
jgi:hypothetical protein